MHIIRREKRDSYLIQIHKNRHKLTNCNMYNTCYLSVHSNLDLTNKSVRPFLFTISKNHYIKFNMLSKSSKWELGFVHYIAKFTISRFVISKFECIWNFLQWNMRVLLSRSNSREMTMQQAGEWRLWAGLCEKNACVTISTKCIHFG